jgi:hypothetical protein
MLLSTVSLVPVAVAFVLALGGFGAWTAYLIRVDHRLLALGATDTVADPRPAPARPVVAIVAPAAAARDWSQPHYLVAAPELVPEPGLCAVVRSGSFCTVVGASGITASGTEMVCSAQNGGRPRWRRAEQRLPRSA